MSAEMLALYERGATYSEIARMLGISRNAVAGSIHRTRHPYPKKGHPAFFDEARVREAVALADKRGLRRASKMLGVDKGQLCRWRQKLRSLEA